MTVLQPNRSHKRAEAQPQAHGRKRLVGGVAVYVRRHRKCVIKCYNRNSSGQSLFQFQVEKKVGLGSDKVIFHTSRCRFAALVSANRVFAAGKQKFVGWNL